MDHSAVFPVASLKAGCWHTLPRSQALTQFPVACSAVTVLQATRSRVMVTVPQAGRGPGSPHRKCVSETR